MSELIQKNDNRATIRWKLLTGASALALAAYVSSPGLANAEDTDHPSIWLELGGQMEMESSFSNPFTAPFLTQTPTPDPFKGVSPIDAQRTPRYALGLDGKITFQPEGSDWSFSASLRYGRAHGNTRVHHETKLPSTFRSACINFYGYLYCDGYTNPNLFKKVSDTRARHNERHIILDFQAGKDVGLGLLGRDGTSRISAGIRIAQFRENSQVDVYARPNVIPVFPPSPFDFYVLAVDTFHQYFLHARAERSFTGVGPSLSWSGSAPIAGNEQDGELAIDFGIDAAVLFGRQKANTSHSTNANQVTAPSIFNPQYKTLYPTTSHADTRSRRVTVPNFGGSVGLSLSWANAKISMGYRYDTFLNAMDTGIDKRKASAMSFQGPYASISIGLGD